MRTIRIYQPTQLVSGETISLTPDAAHHLIKVLRLSTGEVIQVFNGEGGEYSATIASITKQQVSIQIGEYWARDVESPLQIHLGQAISRGEKMDYTIQKAVELGVTKITPLFTERCGVKLSQERWEKRLQHWRSIIISACEQCGRNRLPIITEPALMAEWVQQGSGGCKIILHPEATQNLKTITSVKNIILLVGPEGGFTTEEVSSATQHHFLGMTLGPRILRTETAALVAMAILQAKWGDIAF